MKWNEASRLPTWIIKLIRYEFWPWQVFYYPLYPYLIFLSLKYRKAFAFSAINPRISADSGLFTASKSQIMGDVPNSFKPKEGLLLGDFTYEKAIELKESLGIKYPLICKPNFGERGENVELVSSDIDLKNYLMHWNGPLVIQEFIDWKEEFGVTFFKHPITNEVTITSIGQKEFLKVIGNGRECVKELLLKSLRGRIFLKTIDKNYANKLTIIPKEKEIYIVEPIGNHCRGTKFINRNDLLHSKDLLNKIKKIVLPLEGFHFGRIDLKTKSLEDLVYSQNPFKVFEINAVHAEPAHIYDPNYSIFKAYKDLYAQWNQIYAYGKICANQGVPCLKLKNFITLVIQRHQK